MGAARAMPPSCRTSGAATTPTATGSPTGSTRARTATTPSTGSRASRGAPAPSRPPARPTPRSRPSWPPSRAPGPAGARHARAGQRPLPPSLLLRGRVLAVPAGVGHPGGPPRPAGGPGRRRPRARRLRRARRRDPDIVLHLPVADIGDRFPMRIPWWREWLAHPTEDEYWRAREILHRFDRIRIPVYHIGGWHDDFVSVPPANFSAAAAASPAVSHRLLMGMWPHALNERADYGGLDYGPDAVIDLRARGEAVARPVAPGRARRAGRRAAGPPLRDGPQRLAGLRALAARDHHRPTALPARRRAAVLRSTGSGASGRLPLRSRPAGAAAVGLRRVGHAHPAGLAPRPIAPARPPALCVGAAASPAHRDRKRPAAPLRRVHRAGHRLVRLGRLGRPRHGPDPPPHLRILPARPLPPGLRPRRPPGPRRDRRVRDRPGSHGPRATRRRAPPLLHPEQLRPLVLPKPQHRRRQLPGDRGQGRRPDDLPRRRPRLRPHPAHRAGHA